MSSSAANQLPARLPASLSIVLLAAGSSSRLGQPKQLLPFKGTTLVAERVKSILNIASPGSELIVVTGAARDRVLHSLDGQAFKECFNAVYRDGMSGSLKKGLEAISPTSSGCMILLVDQPFISPQHLIEMAAKWEKNEDKIVAASYAGLHGVPVIFPRSYFRLLLSLQGDQGARKALAHLTPEEIVSYHLPEAGVDIDTVEDLKQLDD
jgi:molybdenum cofactor cytidylyltransferase